MTRLVVHYADIASRHLERASIIASAMRAGALEHGDAFRILWDAIAESIDGEYSRRQISVRTAPRIATIHDADTDPRAMDVAIGATVSALARLRAEAEHPGIAACWAAIQAELTNIAERRRIALDALERAYGAPVISREKPGSTLLHTDTL